jgi:Glycosyl hydrolase family 59
MAGELRGERTCREPVPQGGAVRAAKVIAKVAAVAVLVAGCGTTVAAEPHGRPLPTPTAARAAGRAAIVINGARPGPVFQGIGAISGGGGDSRLLIDYPAPERGQILDYLFTPHFGASLQMLKLEIGGGGYSSDGSEPSVEPVQSRLDCGAGYEFWLARQALARNPAIKLYGLQWSAPSWVRDRNGGLWTTADVDYVIGWLRCARDNGLAISYVGGWDEHYQGTAVQRAWFVDLRRALDLAGFTSTQIVAADQTPQLPQGHGRPPGYSPLRISETVADDMAEDPAFARAVSVVGLHDTCGLPTTGYRCVMAAAARTVAARTGKPLWESELGATPSTGTDPALPGPGGLARALNNACNQAGITGILVWPLIDAIPPDLPHENQGLVRADSPWDGNYDVTPVTWVIAQTTQFTAPGWRHVDQANGGLPGGSYDTYEAPGRSAWTLVAQTSVASTAQQATVHVTGGLPAQTVHVWSTNLRGPGQFVRRGDITPHGGTFTTVLQPGFVYTFTTTTGQSRAGGHPPAVPAAGPMPLPYAAAPDAAGMARMLCPIEGSFGYVHGLLTQTTLGEPVEWQYPGPSPAPYAIVGQNTWRDYTVSARVVLPPSGTASPPPGAGLIARFQGFGGTTVSQFRGYELQVRGDGAWQIAANGPVPVTLASGRVNAAHAYAMSLTTRGATIVARINGTHVATVTNGTYRDGPAGLASLGYYPVRYLSFGVS